MFLIFRQDGERRCTTGPCRDQLLLSAGPTAAPGKEKTVPHTPAPHFDPVQAALLREVGGAAPSIANSQPWRFAVGSDRIDVWTDLERQLPAVDPDGRQRLLSCGAAILNLRLAVAYLGFDPRTRLCPDPTSPEHVATVWRGAPRSATPDERQLYGMVHWRHTNRAEYRPNPLPAPVLRRLVTAVTEDSAQLRRVDGATEQAAVAGLIVRGVDIEAHSPEVRREFARWLTDDPEPAMGTSVGSWLASPYPMPALTGQDRLTPGERAGMTQLAEHSTLAVLHTAGDGPVDRLRAGQALQRLLLTATAYGVAVAFLNQPVEVPELRAELRTLLDTGVPQVLVRLGYARYPAQRTRRLPVRPPG